MHPCQTHSLIQPIFDTNLFKIQKCVAFFPHFYPPMGLMHIMCVFCYYCSSSSKLFLFVVDRLFFSPAIMLYPVEQYEVCFFFLLSHKSSKYILYATHIPSIWALLFVSFLSAYSPLHQIQIPLIGIKLTFSLFGCIHMKECGILIKRCNNMCWCNFYTRNRYNLLTCPF